MAAVLLTEAFNHKNLQSVDGRIADGMSVMAMAAHTGLRHVYGSTSPDKPHLCSIKLANPTAYTVGAG